MKHYIHILGTRPNFIKAASIINLMAAEGFAQAVIHTGQHYDELMSDTFFKELNIPMPVANFHEQSMHGIMAAFDQWLEMHDKPSAVIIYGDVRSSVACAITAAENQIPIIHIESGLRSFDKSMPEERNRIIIDHLADHRFVTEFVGLTNLTKENLKHNNYLVGNSAIDTLRDKVPMGILPGSHVTATIHRPFNTDDPHKYAMILEKLNALQMNVVMPVHPRARYLNEDLYPNIEFVDPLGYLEFNTLLQQSYAVITDSGGVQTDAAVMRVPTLTLRPSTEHQLTVKSGLNKLIGVDDITPDTITNFVSSYPKLEQPMEWDGRACIRIVEKINELGL